MNATFDLSIGLLKTATRRMAGDPARDALADLAAARAWSPVPLDEDDLAPLRDFREALRDALRPGAGPPDEPANRITSSVSLFWDPVGEMGWAPAGTGWPAVAGLVTMELIVARAAGRLRRLKTCSYDPCGWPFIDDSRNVSRMWHDTARCGNLVNLRNHRARRGTAPRH